MFSFGPLEDSRKIFFVDSFKHCFEVLHLKSYANSFFCLWDTVFPSHFFYVSKIIPPVNLENSDLVNLTTGILSAWLK